MCSSDLHSGTEMDVEAAAAEEGGAVSEIASEDSDRPKKPEKRAPIKMPKSASGPTTKNTKEAATETLKKYFGGR